MVRFSNGFYSFSDSYLKNMRKQDLINYIRTIEKNWENQLITNDIQYNNCMKLLAEERNKAIDEFIHKLLSCNDKDELRMMIPYEYIYKVAEDMKEGV